MFTNPTRDAQHLRELHATQRARVHQTADAVHRAVYEHADAEIVAALLQQLRTLTAHPLRKE